MLLWGTNKKSLNLDFFYWWDKSVDSKSWSMFWLLNVNIATSGKRHLKRNKCISDKESEPVWEWAGVVLHVGRAQSQWHGWSARHGRKGKRGRVTVRAYFAHDSPLTNYLHIRWSFSWKHFDFWKLFLGLLGMTEPRAVPVAEPVFLRGTRTLWLFSRKNFSIQATPSLWSNCAHVCRLRRIFLM